MKTFQLLSFLCVLAVSDVTTAFCLVARLTQSPSRQHSHFDSVTPEPYIHLSGGHFEVNAIQGGSEGSPTSATGARRDFLASIAAMMAGIPFLSGNPQIASATYSASCKSAHTLIILLVVAIVCETLLFSTSIFFVIVVRFSFHVRVRRGQDS
jgi:hypothetical protein